MNSNNQQHSPNVDYRMITASSIKGNTSTALQQ